jgi:acyl carrier protein
MSVRDRVKEYILELTNEPGIDDSVNLFESGHLTSLDVLDLLCFIEGAFNIVVSDDDLGMDNFGSIDRIVNYIENTLSKE